MILWWYGVGFDVSGDLSVNMGQWELWVNWDLGLVD